MSSDRQTSLKLLATASTGRAVSSASSFDESDIPLPVGSPPWTILSVTLFVTYIILMSAMPFYNKVLFQIYTKPITATLIQLFGVIIFLFFYCIFMKKYEIYQSKKIKKSPYNDNNNNIENNNSRKHSHARSHSHSKDHSHNHGHTNTHTHTHTHTHAHTHNHSHHSHNHNHNDNHHHGHGHYHHTHKNNNNNNNNNYNNYNNNDNFVITNSNSINNNNNSRVVSGIASSLSPANDSRISNTTQTNDADSLVEIIKELLFYNNLKMRVYYLILPSFFFSGSILLTNIGIDLASVDISTLLRTSEIIWFVILTPIITKKDFPTWIAIIAAIIVMIGTFLFSFSVLKTHDVTPIALIINIASSVFTPFQIVYLKRATNVLCDVSSIEREEYGIRVMKSYEITFIKLFLSLIFIIPCALIVEQFEAWRALTEGFKFECNILVVLFGVIMTCLFQWNTVSLTNYVEPVLIGVGSQLKTIFSYLGSLIVSGVVLYVCNCINKDNNESNDCKSSDNKYPDCPCFDNAKNEFTGQFATIHIIGVILIVIGMISYTYIKYKNKHITNVSCCKQCRLS